MALLLSFRLTDAVHVAHLIAKDMLLDKLRVLVHLLPRLL